MRELEPGWVWSEHVGRIAGSELCEVEHIGMAMSGRATVKMRDGTELVPEPGDAFAIPLGHDSWVIGDEPHVSLHLLGATDYAARHRAR